MASTDASVLVDNTLTYINNPAKIQQGVLSYLDAINDGSTTVVDVSNPFVQSLETAAFLTSAFMSNDATGMRKRYPQLAQDVSDLYYHMSYKDYIGRFATPGTCSVYFNFEMAELTSKLVEDTTTGIKKLVIPKNTYFTVAGVVYSIQYPIVITQFTHGGLQVAYDTTTTSPLQTLSTNIIEWSEIYDSNTSYMIFQVPVFQFSIVSTNTAVTTAAPISLSVTFTDQFYYARVYMKNSSDTTWTEIYTTHSDMVYDNSIVTATLSVSDTTLKVTIPLIYITTGMVDGQLRVDLYQTKGDYAMDLGAYTASNFVTTFYDYDTAGATTTYTAPLATMSKYQIYSDAIVAVGTDGLSFAALKEQVIKGTTVQTIPITPGQLGGVASMSGFTLNEVIDNVTNRKLIAAKALPAPTNSKLITAANVSIETLSTTLANLLSLSSVIDNTTANAAVTITPDTLFLESNGVVSLVTSTKVAQIKAMTPDQQAVQVNAANYLYTPFYYVLDMADDEFNVRPYSLNDPSAITNTFVSTNDTTQLEVSTGSYSLTKVSTGYQLSIVTSSSAAFKALDPTTLKVQLSYIPPGETAYAYMLATYVGVSTDTSTAGEFIFKFSLTSSMHVDSDDYLQLSSFMMYTTASKVLGSPLENTFDLIYATTSTMPTGYSTADVDTYLSSFLMSSSTAGITHEQIKLKFGDALTDLWAGARSVIGDETYATYATDVPDTWANTVLDTNTDGTNLFEVDGVLDFKILHNAGDVKTDSSGNVIYLHKKGDTILDSSGNPTIANERTLARYLDILMVEGVYAFATDSIATAYVSELKTTLLDYITVQLPALVSETLELTELDYYPVATMGLVTVTANGATDIKIPAYQAFTVNLYVSSTVYKNTQLRTQLTSNTITVINTQLAATTLAKSTFIEALLTSYGSDVYAVDMTGFGSSGSYEVVTITDTKKSIGLRKKLVAQADNTLIVSEDCTVNFINQDA